MRFAKNLGWLVVSEGVSRLVQFVALAYLARVLGTAGLGTFNWVQSIGLTMATLPNFGLNEYGILKIAPDRSVTNVGRVTSDVLSLRSRLGGLGIAGLFVATVTVPQFAGYRGLLLTAMALQVATVFTFDWFYTAIERQAVVGIARLIARLTYLIATLVFVRSTDDLLVALLIFFGTELGLSACLLLLSFRVTPWTFTFATRVRLREVLKQAWPLAIYIANASVLYYVDLVIIGLLMPMADAGVYGGGMRIVTGLVALKFLIGQLIYPKLARRVGRPGDVDELARLVAVVNRYGLMLGLGILAATATFAPEIIWFVLGGDFMSGASVFALLSVALLAEFAWLAYPYLVISMNLRAYAAIMVCTGTIKVVSLYLVLPRGGLVAAALVYVACSVSVFLLSIAYVRRRLATMSTFKLVVVPVAFAAVLVMLPRLEASLGARVAVFVVAIIVVALYVRSLGQRFDATGIKDDVLVLNA